MHRALVGVLLVMFGAATAVGQIWSPAGPELFPVLCGAISSVNPQVAVVAVSKGTAAVLYFTTDRGSNWSTITESLTFRPLAITFEHGSDSVLYVTAGDVFRSTDRGLTWSQLGTPGGTVWLNLALDPTDSGEVWLAGYSDASTHGRASVAISTDAGTTWTMLVCDTTSRSSAHSIALDPSRDSTLYCGGSIAGRAVVYKSTDKGASWVAHDLPSPAKADSGTICSPPAPEVPVLGQVRFLYVNPLNTSSLLAAQPWYGVCRSTNGGASWYHYPGFSEAHSLAFSPLQPQLVYVGATKGIYRTTDAGRTWSGLYQPPYGGTVDCVLTCADSALFALATNGSGVLRTRDEWGDWGSLAVLDAVSVTALTTGGAAPENMYAAIAGFGIFSSTDPGRDWSRCRGFPGSDSAVSLAASVSDVWALDDAGLYYSTNRGEAWTLKGDWFDSAGDVAASQPPASIVVATGRLRDSLAVLFSTDSGQAWSQSLLCGGGMGRAVALSSVEPGRFLVGGDSAGNAILYATRDTGRTWVRAGTGLNGTINCIRFGPSSRNDLYCGTSDGAYHSSDTGRTWQDRGLSDVNSIVYTQRGAILAGTDSGVFVTYSGGGTWYNYSSGLVDSQVTSVATAPPGYNVFAGTKHAGLFLGYEPPGISEEQRRTSCPRDYLATIVRRVLFLPSLPAADCSLLSADGRKLSDLHPGANDVRALAPGVYFIRGPKTEGGRPGVVRKVVITR